MKYTFLIALLFCIFLGSCTKEHIKIDPDNMLLGYWNFSGSQDDISIYQRSSGFGESFGYRFISDGTLVQRKTDGWCATPPVSYAEYPGTWSILNDTLIQIHVGYWGGTQTFKLDIESVTSDYLKFREVYDGK